MYRCPFDDCRSTDIVGTDGGVSTMMATMYNGRSFDGNQKSLPFRCKSCGESFLITYQVTVPDRIEVTTELLNELFPDDYVVKNKVAVGDKKNGKHLP